MCISKGATAADITSIEELLVLARKALAALPKANEALPIMQIDIVDEGGAEHEFRLVLDGSLPPEVAMRAATASDGVADVRLRVSLAACGDMFAGKLSIVKAVSQRKVRILKGDPAQLRKLGTHLAGLGDAAMHPGRVAASVSVQVVSTHVDEREGHGVYILRVSEGASSWMVGRRWRQLVTLRAALDTSFGASTPYGQAISTLPRAFFPRSSSSASVLRQRSHVLERWMASVLRQIPCSVIAAHGPRSLQNFLRDAGPVVQRVPHAPRPLTNEAGSGAGRLSEGMGEEEVAVPLTHGSDSGATGDLGAASDSGATGGSSFAGHVGFAGLLRRHVSAAYDDKIGALSARVTQANTLAVCAVVALTLFILVNSAGSSGRAAEPSFGGAALSAGAALPLLVLCPAIVWPLCSAGLSRGVASQRDLLVRYLAVCHLFGRVLLAYKYTKLWRCRGLPVGDGVAAAEWEVFHEWLGSLLYRRLMALGGLWLKVGQYIASRSDMVPDAIIRHLSRMLDANPPRPLSETLDTLHGAWGATAESCLETLDPKALSVGSIAQVHVGSMRTCASGALPPRVIKVAVKVQHADIAPLMRQDLAQCDVLSTVLAWVEPSFDFRPVLREINAEHAKELDFRQEAASLTQVRANLEGGRTPVVVPRVINELTSASVLVMEFCEGHSVKDASLLRAAGVDCDVLLMRVCEAWAKMMFTDGCFNADPHAGNILARHDEHLGSMPVLLDFGLTKRLSEDERLSFCMMLHALEELDGDLLLSALVGLGFRMRSSEIEPSEVFRDLLFTFRDSSGDAAASRALNKAKLHQDLKRGKVYSKDAKEHVKSGKKPPLEALPGCVIFFVRTVEMLQGLATRLGVSVPIMQPMANHARQAILKHNAIHSPMPFAATLAATDPAPCAVQLGRAPPMVGTADSTSQIPYVERTPATMGALRLRPSRTPAGPTLQERVLYLMHALEETGELLGGQCSVIHQGHLLVDAAAGRMGMVDPREVTPSSLFQLFEAGCPLLATLVAQSAEEGQLRMDAPVCAAWSAFGAAGKGQLTVEQLLSHRGGLHAAMPARARLAQLLDWRAMEAHVAAASLDAAAASGGASAHFGGATWGWALSGLLRAASREDAASLLESRISAPLGCEHELLLREPTACGVRVCKHSQSSLMKELGMDVMGLTGGGSSTAGGSSTGGGSGAARREKAAGGGEANGLSGVDGDDVFAASSSEVDWERFQGPQQLQVPSTFNAQAVRTAGIPGCAMLGSARALARFYAALGGAKLVTPATLRRMATQQTSGTLNGESVRWGLGVQLGTLSDRHSRTSPVLGHRGGAGGVIIGFAAPAADLSVAIVVSKLSVKRDVTTRLLELVLSEVGGGWTLDQGLA